MQYAIILIVSLAQGPAALIQETRYYPFPNLATCEDSLKAALELRRRELAQTDARHTWSLTKAVCEPLG